MESCILILTTLMTVWHIPLDIFWLAALVLLIFPWSLLGMFAFNLKYLSHGLLSSVEQD